MNYRLHPEAALEHEEQASYYETRQSGLGQRYHAAFRSAISRVCEAPQRYPVIRAPAIRRIRLVGFPFSVIFREVASGVQVLAIAHHRKRPGYWSKRL